LQIVYVSELVAGKQSPGAPAGLTTEQTLTRLLDGTGLTYKFLTDHTVSLHKSGGQEDATTGTRPSPNEVRLAQVDSSQATQTAPATDASVEKRLQDEQAASQTTPGKLEEILVTAQKREERLQDVPIPMAAINAQSLTDNGQLRIQDYYSQVPGLNMVLNDYGSPQLVIRGITTGGYVNPTVGIVVDDVPFNSSSGLAFGEFSPDFDPSDLARIEVLRGPQGTLYGASSIGGLIKFVTVDPSTDGVSGHVESGLSGVYNGSQLGYNVRGAINVPLSSTLAIRASGFSRQDPGYIDDPGLNARGVNEAEVYGGHLSTLWKPASEFSLKLSALVQHASATGLPNVDIEPGLGDLQQSAVRGSGASERTYQAYSATVNAKLGAAALTSISGYNISRADQGFDYSHTVGGATQLVFQTPGTVVRPVTTLHKFTEEVRLSLALGSKLDWLVGGFYTHENATQDDVWRATFPDTGSVVGVGLDFNDPSRFTEYAAFTDLTLHVTDRFDVQLGARQSYNRQYYVVTSTGPFVPIFFRRPSPYVEGPTHSKDNSATYLLTPRFRLTPDIMIYARFSSGYQPGGPNINTAGIGIPSQFNAETTDDYDIGIKSDVLDHRVSFDASLYHINWKSLQLYLTDPTTGSNYYANGGGAKSEGLELSVQARATQHLTAGAWITYDEAVLTSSFPATDAVHGVSGDRLPYGSRVSGNVSLDGQFMLAGNWEGFAGILTSYTGDRLGQFTATGKRQAFPGYAQTNVHLGARAGSWTITAYANNILDRRGLLDGGLGTFDVAAFQYIAPRTIGFSAATTF